jgi:hypothetical protein
VEPERFAIETGGNTYELGPAQLAGVLFQLVTTLVFEKQVDRATFILAKGEKELSGSGGSHFDPVSVSLYRHLKEERYHGPLYEELGGEAQSFRIRGIAYALVAVAFFLRGGDGVPHLIIGRPDADPLVVLDRGARTRLSCDDPDTLAQLIRMIPR